MQNNRLSGKQVFRKTVFLDRDGVINHDSPDYIKSWAEFEFLPGSLDALKNLNQNGFLTIVISNQSMIGRNLSSKAKLEEIFMRMNAAVKAAGGNVTDVFYCPHLPEEGCECRKPKPGLIHKARDKYTIDLSQSYMVGDSVKDIECARNSGCGYAVLVRTGNGKETEVILNEKGTPPDYVADNLFDAVQWIIQMDGKTPSHLRACE